MQNIDTPLPLTGQERIVTLDIIRGIALLGILLVNMQLFYSPVLYTNILDIQWWTDPWDKSADYFITIFAEGKFYPIFSFLFGFGFYIFMVRAEQKGKAVAGLYLRRIFLLFLFGILHILLLWWGDILHFYAVIGLLLLFFYKKRSRTLLLWSASLLLIPVILVAVLFFAGAATKGETSQVATVEALKSYSEYANQMIKSSLEIYSEGNFTEIYRQRINDFFFATQNMYFLAPQVLALFLLGMYTARTGLIQNAHLYHPLLKKIWLFSLIAGGPLVFLQFSGKYNLFANFTANEVFYFTGTITGGTLIGIFYIITIVLLAEKKKVLNKIYPLAHVGRMALTNYILQSVISTTIFYGYGLGMYGKVGPTTGVALTLLIFSGQILFSNLWLKYYLFGPLEWLWRTLTYGKIQPFKTR